MIPRAMRQGAHQGAIFWRICSLGDKGELELGKDVSHNSPQQLNEIALVDYSS